MAVPSRCPRRDSPEKIQILKTDVSYDYFADNYFETETDYAENIRKARVAEKVFWELYFMLVVVPDEFDFSVCRLGASYLIPDTSS